MATPFDTGSPNSWKLMGTILAAAPRAAMRAPWPYCPSPNLSSMSRTSASMAPASSSPTISISISEPIPAASIMTPMMLFALTRRPLRLRKISLRKLPASLVSFADARACRPSLLLILAVFLITSAGLARLVLRSGDRHLHDALRRSGNGPRNHGIERVRAVAKGTPEHRHVHPGDDLDLDAVGQPLRDVAGGCAEHVREDQGFRRSHAFEQPASLGLDFLDRHVREDIERGEIRGAVGIRMLGHRLERRRERRMGNDQKSRHGGALSTLQRTILI